MSARIGRTVGLLAVAAIAVGWLILFRPVVLGGPATYLVVSGDSMEPSLHGGDLVIVRADAPYRAGDVVAFRVPDGHPGAGSLVIHRVIGGNVTQGFVVQGDNKDAPDPWRPTSTEILGRSWITVPGSGRLLLAAKEPIVLAALLGASAGLLVLASGSGRSQPRPPIELPWHGETLPTAEAIGEGQVRRRGGRA
jgi:signal peptidase